MESDHDLEKILESDWSWSLNQWSRTEFGPQKK